MDKVAKAAEPQTPTHAISVVLIPTSASVSQANPYEVNVVVGG